MNSKETAFMARALELAELGRGHVSPNPMVGCVIVHNDRIIGEGWHKKYGGPHAEVNAINSVADQALLSESTVYVTLEPCAHHGKTPPCAELLVEKKVKRVVIAAADSNPLVNGKGADILRASGIEVEEGLLEDESRALNRSFFTSIERKRPYIILKWAQTEDGFIARENFDSKWISNRASRSLVHQWRAEEDAIMVGRITAEHDNPKLNVRDWHGSDPLRVVIDKQLSLKKSLHLFDRSQETVVYNGLKDEEGKGLNYVKVTSENYLPFILKDLHKRKIQSIFVEGGSALLGSFLEASIWDEARVFTAPVSFSKGISAPKMFSKNNESLGVGLDTLDIYYNQEPSDF